MPETRSWGCTACTFDHVSSRCDVERRECIKRGCYALGSPNHCFQTLPPPLPRPGETCLDPFGKHPNEPVHRPRRPAIQLELCQTRRWDITSLACAAILIAACLSPAAARPFGCLQAACNSNGCTASSSSGLLLRRHSPQTALPALRHGKVALSACIQLCDCGRSIGRLTQDHCPNGFGAFVSHHNPPTPRVRVRGRAGT